MMSAIAIFQQLRTRVTFVTPFPPKDDIESTHAGIAFSVRSGKGKKSSRSVAVLHLPCLACCWPSWRSRNEDTIAWLSGAAAGHIGTNSRSALSDRRDPPWSLRFAGFCLPLLGMKRRKWLHTYSLLIIGSSPIANSGWVVEAACRRSWKALLGGAVHRLAHYTRMDRYDPGFLGRCDMVCRAAPRRSAVWKRHSRCIRAESVFKATELATPETDESWRLHKLAPSIRPFCPFTRVLWMLALGSIRLWAKPY